MQSQQQLQHKPSPVTELGYNSTSPAAQASPVSTTSTDHKPNKSANGSTPDESYQSHQPHPTATSTTSTGEKRVPLACLRCRAKRARCSGERPVCAACAKVNEECTWPTGRRRKRTRKEMEEEEKREREVALMTGASNASLNPFAGIQQQQPQPLSAHSSSVWHNGGSMPPDHIWDLPNTQQLSTSYLWPPPTPSTNQHSPSNSSNLVPDSPAFQQSTSSTSLFPFSTGSPGTSEKLFHALESPVAFIEGDPSRQENLELYYYRFSGSTAIHPGINRISLKLQSRNTNAPSSAASAPVPSSQPQLQSPMRAEHMFDSSGFPAASIHIPLLDTFFRTMSQHFPSISRRRMKERLETGTMSAFLLNCICAVSARFHTPANDNPAKTCEPFITKAQELIIPLLQLPTTDVVTGLLLLAWANYGQNSESGLWQYSGMAFRMAIDLGLHEVSEIYETAAHVVRTRLLFWSLFITDRILAFATGRPPSISEEIVEIPLPTDEDFFPDPARTDDPLASVEQVQPVSFQYMVRLMVLCGRIAQVLNGRRGRPRTLFGPSAQDGDERGHGQLKELQAQLVQFYSTLPSSLQWSVDAFKGQEARGHGSSFLTLHLWANAVMAMTYHPELTTSPSGTETPLSQNMERSVKLSLASSRTISECLVFADLFASQSYLASPFVVQPIYVACLAFIDDMKHGSLGYQSTDKRQTVDMLLTSLARQNLSVLMKAMQAMEHYWAGIAYVSNILEQRAAGLGHHRIDTALKEKKTFISLPDTGLLRRFTDKHLPHNTAPPTETSLRTSMANDGNNAVTCSLNDLLSTYSVEGMFVQPADSYDLQSLLSSGYKPHGESGGVVEGEQALS